MMTETDIVLFAIVLCAPFVIVAAAIVWLLRGR